MHRNITRPSWIFDHQPVLRFLWPISGCSRITPSPRRSQCVWLGLVDCDHLNYCSRQSADCFRWRGNNSVLGNSWLPLLPATSPGLNTKFIHAARWSTSCWAMNSWNASSQLLCDRHASNSWSAAMHFTAEVHLDTRRGPVCASIESKDHGEGCCGCGAPKCSLLHFSSSIYLAASRTRIKKFYWIILL